MRIPPLPWLFLISSFLALSCVDIVFVSCECLDDQRLLLLQLKGGGLVYNSLLSTKLVRWDQNKDCCDWDGVACDNLGRVIGLELDNESISGLIENSSSLLGFQYLERLNLAYNTFNSTQIPAGIYNLTNLTYLNLSNAGFGRQIPIQLSRMRRLEVLDLSTLFPGIEPLKLENPNLKTFVDSLTELSELYLDGVNISAQRTDWCQALSTSLPNLRVLSLSNCQISGPIDNSLIQLQYLSVIRLNQNNLSTAVPDYFAEFTNLTNLQLTSCNLIGEFPREIFQVPTLQVVDLSLNKLLSGRLAQFPENGNLRRLVLGYTNFTGQLPDSIGSLPRLSRIELSNCSFSGTIPTALSKLIELVYVDFSFNNFTGPIPSFQMSNKLTYLDLSRNSLNGSVSSHFEGLSDLVYVNLGYNNLGGTIPSYLFGLPSLQKLILPNNKLDGQINWFPNATVSQLDTIDLSSNLLYGPIPVSFFDLRNLNVLSLSSNQFNETMQLDVIKKLQNLTRLELSYNNLSIEARSNSSVPFPQLSILKLASCRLQYFPELKNQTRMIHLDLSDNQIKGEIPRWIWEVGPAGSLTHLNLSRNQLVGLQENYSIPSGLRVIDLHLNHLQGEIPTPPQFAVYVDYSSNNFSGSIPSDIGDSVSFTSFFSLSSNSLGGVVPTSICNTSYLQVLDLSNNYLHGTIPACLFEKIENLGVLNLGKNNLSGNIPYAFSPNCPIKTLDLSRNALEGAIPRTLVNCSLLEVLDIGNNKIKDTFPCMLRNSSNLRVLVLRSNQFHGDLGCPAAGESWSKLQIIDIAFNNFGGNLYAGCFSSWRGMMVDDDKNASQLTHLRYEFLKLNKFYYQDTVTVTIKGMELELVKILTVFTSIDFSRNNFQGPIPETVGVLRSLYVLNLSHNALTGPIPKSIGNLTTLGSLDLSVNQLTGVIPEGLASLNFLAFLNLSFNKLIGMIPTGPQLQTFTDTSFAGNIELCGLPLSTACNRTLAPEQTQKIAFGLDWQFIFTGLGFGVGAASVIAPLAFCTEWRDWCDRHFEASIKLFFPTYGFTYVRYHARKVKTAGEIEEKPPDDTDDSDEDDDEMEDTETCSGRYCVFCTKLDIHMKKAVHDPKCSCHHPPTISSSSISSSSSSLLVLYY